ncbi:2-dehydropantoate 2-reductase [Lindgomyces ingoldianus]|uniref:2-dehydropantoate 2-reductase n=1 Tax=Lindgomyces ingoldianus TaxID=673940 RepID=A0ACB6RGF8_9PLEO|nr:2-dehydropantoate 2-reductase [Lindgomyces ingoldianus]KAF2478329.1 2-dehydropantoate 2-reductase [Lindgomyces ingoldianus]
MQTDPRPKVLLFGAGGVGTVYLYLLSKVSSITAVCRSNYDIVKKDGFIINSSLFGQNIHFTPDVVRDCSEAASLDPRPFDFIIVCSKATPATIPRLIAPAVTPGCTTIALIQNGIGIEDEYIEAFPANPLVSCVVYLPATQRPLGVIKHGEIERLEIGSYPSSASSEHAKAFAELFASAGATAELYEDVQSMRWFKLLANASWNPLCALTQCTDAEFMESSSPATGLVFDIMLEVCDIAKAYGYTISRHEAEHQLGRAKARIYHKSGVEPSMLQDVRSGRKLEVEAIVGNAVRMGKAKGVKCEKLEMLYVLATALDSQVRRDVER